MFGGAAERESAARPTAQRVLHANAQSSIQTYRIWPWGSALVEWTQTSVIGVIVYLLPGFLAAWVFYGLTTHVKQSPFERIVQALIFTAVARGLTGLLRRGLLVLGYWQRWGVWDADADLIWSLCIAVVVGLVFAMYANRDWFHRVFRRLGVTTRTSYPSEWFSAFNRDARYVTLHLSDQRRLLGWPTDWPDQPGSGHFVLVEPAWLLDNGQCAPLHKTERLMVPAAAVTIVEFMKYERDVTATPEELQTAEASLMNAQGSGENHGS